MAVFIGAERGKTRIKPKKGTTPHNTVYLPHATGAHRTVPSPRFTLNCYSKARPRLLLRLIFSFSFFFSTGMVYLHRRLPSLLLSRTHQLARKPAFMSPMGLKRMMSTRKENDIQRNGTY